jgi:hypothetical protein
MSTLGVCMITEPVFKRGRHGQESEEGKEERESHQEGGKENVKEKEVVVSATETAAPDQNPDAKQISSKDLKRALQASRYRGETRQDRTFVQTAAAG